jgi:hypothetical protein
MKPHLLSLLLLIGIFSCSKPEPKTDKQQEESLELIRDYTHKNFMEIAKLDNDLQNDNFNAQVYSVAKKIYAKCDSTHVKLVNLKSHPNPEIVKLKSQQYFDEFIKTVNSIPKSNIWSEVKPMENATSEIDNNILNLWIFTAKCMAKLNILMNGFCEIYNQFELTPFMQKQMYITGDTVRVHTYVEKIKDSKYKFLTPYLCFEQPLKIEEVRLNKSIIKPENLNIIIDQGDIEFIPTQTGKYTITFSKTIERVNRKIETYESRVEFTVLP